MSTASSTLPRVAFSHPDLMARIDAATATLRAEYAAIVRGAEDRAAGICEDRERPTARTSVYNSQKQNNAAYSEMKSCLKSGQEDRLLAIKSALNWYGCEDGAARAHVAGTIAERCVESRVAALRERADRLESAVAAAM